MSLLRNKVRTHSHSFPSHILRSEVFEEIGLYFSPRPRFALILYQMGGKDTSYRIIQFIRTETGWRKLPRTIMAFSNSLIALEAWTYKRLELSKKGLRMMGSLKSVFNLFA